MNITWLLESCVKCHGAMLLWQDEYELVLRCYICGQEKRLIKGGTAPARYTPETGWRKQDGASDVHKPNTEEITVTWKCNYEEYTTRFLIVGDYFGRLHRVYRVYAVYPLDPYPPAVAGRERTALGTRIKEEWRRLHPDYPLSEFAAGKIDLETPVHERAALKEEHGIGTEG